MRPTACTRYARTFQNKYFLYTIEQLSKATKFSTVNLEQGCASSLNLKMGGWRVDTGNPHRPMPYFGKIHTKNRGQVWGACPIKNQTAHSIINNHAIATIDSKLKTLLDPKTCHSMIISKPCFPAELHVLNLVLRPAFVKSINPMLMYVLE